MKAVRQYLASNTDLKKLLGGEYIFLVEKPEKIKCDTYIVYSYKPISGGYIKDYQVEFHIIGKSLNQLIELQDKLIELLDDVRDENLIKDIDMTIRYIKLLNGGGMGKNPDTGNYEMVVFFLCKI